MWLLIVLSFNEVPYFYYLGLGVLVILFFSVQDRLAFFFYIILTIITVFLFLYLAFIEGWSVAEQVLGIGVHFLILIHLFSLYSLSKYIHQFQEDNKLLKIRIDQLEEYILDEGILSKHEFEKQAELVLSTMGRREETGFYIKIDLAKLSKTVRKKMIQSLGGMLYTTLRKNFDLIGQYDDKTLVVLLQNTDEKGLEIINGRMQHLMNERLEDESVQKIKWNLRKIEGQKKFAELVVES